LELKKLGAQLILHASSKDGIERLQMKFEGKRVLFWQSDFTYPETLASGLVPLLDQVGPIDGFVNCVGRRVRRPINLFDTSLIQDAMNVNFTSYMEIIRLLSKRNRFNVGMSILSISSISAHAGAQGVSIYAATKGAVESATRCLAKELCKKGIRINTLVCGQINTESYFEFIENKETKEDPVLERQYMGLLEPEQIALACVFLLSDKSNFMNGVSFPADGGFLQ
jgi:NAD(P)-dependent dehydrogenase (short-subunit alcohol dehydrogenase family)